MFNRRDFLKRFGIGVTAALALASVPASAIQALTLPEAGKLLACEYLLKVYREWCRAHPGFIPERMTAGLELFEAYEGELIANLRFGAITEREGPRNLKFKATRLDCVGHGWQATVTDARKLSRAS